MGAPKKLAKPIHITTILESAQHEILRHLAYERRQPMAEILREAVENFIEKETATRKPFPVDSSD